VDLLAGFRVRSRRARRAAESAETVLFYQLAHPSRNASEARIPPAPEGAARRLGAASPRRCPPRRRGRRL